LGTPISFPVYPIEFLEHAVGKWARLPHVTRLLGIHTPAYRRWPRRNWSGMALAGSTHLMGQPSPWLISRTHYP